MLLSTSIKKHKDFTRRIVATTILNEKSLPYNLHELDTPERAHGFWLAIVANEPDHEPDKENVVVVMLNTRFKPYAWNRIAVGSVNECTAHPREILRPVIAAGAYGFLLMHNHPSGDSSPSRADETITRRLDEAAKLLQIRLLDHIIIGNAEPCRLPYFSFREAGIIG